MYNNKDYSKKEEKVSRIFYFVALAEANRHDEFHVSG